MFEKELAFFIKNQDRLVEQFEGRVLVILGEKVVGDFPTALEAYLYARGEFEPGAFMIQPCEAGAGAYSATISSAAAWYGWSGWNGPYKWRRAQSTSKLSPSRGTVGLIASSPISR